MRPKRSHKLLRKLIKIYKCNPCLWDSEHKAYNDSNAKKQVYQKMLKKYKKHCDDGDTSINTVDDVKALMSGMRSSYRTQRKKVRYDEINKHSP